MDERNFKEGIIEFFKQHRIGEVKSISLEDNFEDDGISIFIAKVITNKGIYWFIENSHYDINLYEEDSGLNAQEIYEFHKECRSAAENDEEIEHIIYGEASLSDDFIKAIGRLTINFANLEFMLALFCGSHIGASYPINEIITSELSFKQLLNISSSIYQHIESDKKNLETFSRLIKQAFRLEEKRNTIIHSCYAGHSKAKLVFRQKSTAKAKRGYQQHYEPIDEMEINELADAMNLLSKEFGLLIYNSSEKNDQETA